MLFNLRFQIFCQSRGRWTTSSRHATVGADPSLRAVNDLLRVVNGGLVRRFVFLQDVDRLLRRGGGFFLVPKLRLNLRLLVVHKVGVWVLPQRLVDPLPRLVHILVVVVIKGRGLIGGARVERSPCAHGCIELFAYLLDIVRGQLHRDTRFIPKETKRCGRTFHIIQRDRERLDRDRKGFRHRCDTRGIVLLLIISCALHLRVLRKDDGPLVRCRNRKECVLTGRDLLAAERYRVAKLNFGDGVGARAPELPVRHQAAENLAAVLVRARIIHLDIGQPDTLFYDRVLAGRGELYFFLFPCAQAARQKRSRDEQKC